MRKKMIIILSFIIGIISVFFISYNISNKLYGNKEKEVETSGKAYSKLSDNVLIVLKEQNGRDESSIKETKITVSDFKEEKDIDGDITKDSLEKYYSDFSLVSEDDSEIVFLKKSSAEILPNKYYIGEKDGFFAIYKSDESKNLIIEDEKTDVFRDIRKVEVVKEEIKNGIKNLKYEFDTKDEAEEYLSLIAS